MTKLTNLTYQGRKVIGPFGPEDKPTRAGYYPGSVWTKRNAKYILSRALFYGAGIPNCYFWDGTTWKNEEASARATHDGVRYWYALEGPK